MKNFFWKTMIAMATIVLSAGLFSSCHEDEDEVTVSQSEVKFSADGGQQSIQINSNTKWTIIGTQNWLKVTPVQGTENGSITLTAEANTTDNERDCTLYINAGDASTTIVVKQEWKSLADQVAGTYSGRLTMGETVIEDAYIIMIQRLTDTTVKVTADFFSSPYNFTLSRSGNQIAFNNASLNGINMYVMGNTLVVNFANAAGSMTTYTGTK